MPTVTAGSTASYTLPSQQQITLTFDQGERAEWEVRRSGVLVASGSATTTRTIGPFNAGDVLSITASRGAVDYAAASYSSVPGDGKIEVPLDTSGVASAAGNSALIAAALGTAGVHCVLGGAGVAYIADSIVIGDDSTLEISPGLIVRLAGGTNKAALKNSRALSSAVQITGAFTASGTVGAINHIAHGKAVGDVVYVSGATASGYNGAFLVIGVASADQYTVRLPFAPSVSTATGTITVRPANRNITICGSGVIDFNGAAQSLTNDYNSMSVVMHGVYGLTLRDHTVRGSRKYGWLIGGCSHFHWGNLRVENDIDPGSDGLHMMGPILHSTGDGLYGRTGDDFLSMTIGDYPEWEISRGDFYDIQIRGLHCAHSTRNIWKYCGNAPFTADQIDVDGIAGEAVINAAIITDDTNLVGTKGGRIAIRNISAVTGSAASAVALAATGRIERLTVDGVVVDRVGGAVVSVGSGSVYGDLEVSGLTSLATRATNSSLVRVASAVIDRLRVSGNGRLAGGHVVHLNSLADTASVGSLVLAGFRGVGNSSSYGVYHEKGAVGKVTFDGVVIDTFAELYRQSSTAATAAIVAYRGIRVSNITRVSELQASAHVTLSDVYGSSISSLPLKFSTTGQSYRVEGDANFVGSSADIGIGGTPAVYVKGTLRCPGEILSGTANDEFWNTNSAWTGGSGTDKRGRYGYTGSAWAKIFGPA